MKGFTFQREKTSQKIGNLNDFFCLTEKMVIDIVPWSVLSTDRPETYRSQAVPVYLRGKN